MLTLGWAFYLACSWTWCIALFIPVILHHDAGNGAWSILFLCDVIGATAFAFVLRNPAASRTFVQTHHKACRVFSIVTIACQALFAGWLASRLPITLNLAMLALLALAALLLPIARKTIATLAWCATIAALAAYINNSPLAAPLATLQAETLGFQPHALYVAPLLLLGFALSPYLDLTLHESLQSSPSPRLSFLIAFPLLFGAMLLGALTYRDELAPLLLDPQQGPQPRYIQLLLMALFLQVGLTIVIHLKSLSEQPRTRTPYPTILALVLATLAYTAGDTQLPQNLSLDTLLYRSSLGFYGILAPAYVWAIAANPQTRPHPTAFVVILLALLLAAIPMLHPPTALPLYTAAFALVVATRWLRTPNPPPSLRSLAKRYGIKPQHHRQLAQPQRRPGPAHNPKSGADAHRVRHSAPNACLW